MIASKLQLKIKLELQYCLLNMSNKFTDKYNKEKVKTSDEEIEFQYEKTQDYWSKRDCTIEDMLGGFPEINEVDIKISKKLIEELINLKLLKPNSVIDCGAGIGRVTDNVLKYYFKEIDLVEMNPKFTNYAKDYFINNRKIKNIFCSPIQSFRFSEKYDCIWIQWCLENLNDRDLKNFLKNCHENLKDDGLVIIKENIEEEKDYIISDSDFSKIRSDKIFRQFFERQKFIIYRHFYHPFWPSDLMKVSIYVLSKANLI